MQPRLELFLLRWIRRAVELIGAPDPSFRLDIELAIRGLERGLTSSGGAVDRSTASPQDGGGSTPPSPTAQGPAADG